MAGGENPSDYQKTLGQPNKIGVAPTGNNDGTNVLDGTIKENRNKEAGEKASTAISQLLQNPNAIHIFLTDQTIYNVIADGWMNGKLEPKLVSAFTEKIVEAYRQLRWVISPLDQVSINFRDIQANKPPVIQLSFNGMEAKVNMVIAGRNHLVALPWMGYGPSTETPQQTANRLATQVDSHYLIARQNILAAMQNLNDPNNFRIIAANWNMRSETGLPLINRDEQTFIINNILIPKIRSIPKLNRYTVVSPESFTFDGGYGFNILLMAQGDPVLRNYIINSLGVQPPRK